MRDEGLIPVNAEELSWWVLLNNIRRASGYYIREIAPVSGVCAETVINYENKRRNPVRDKSKISYSCAFTIEKILWYLPVYVRRYLMIHGGWIPQDLMGVVRLLDNTTHHCSIDELVPELQKALRELLVGDLRGEERRRGLEVLTGAIEKVKKKKKRRLRKQIETFFQDGAVCGQEKGRGTVQGGGWDREILSFT